MIIDCIADLHGHYPNLEGLPIETMQIVTALSYKEVQVDDFPTGMKAEPESIKVRLFWRAQK